MEEGEGCLVAKVWFLAYFEPDFSSFSVGVAPKVAAVIGFGYVNVSIQCCGAQVNPGDVVVPYGEVKAVLERTIRILENEEKVLAKVKAEAKRGMFWT